MKLEMASDTLAMGIDTWGDYGMTSEAYLLQDANVPLTMKKGSLIDILLWGIFWLHLR